MSAIIKQGYLTKQGGFVKSWKKRFFVLTESRMEYYTEQNGKLKGTIEFDGTTTCQLAHECKRQPAFQISTPERIYYLQPDNYPDCDSWIETVKGVLRKLSSTNNEGGLGQAN